MNDHILFRNLKTSGYVLNSEIRKTSTFRISGVVVCCMGRQESKQDTDISGFGIQTQGTMSNASWMNAFQNMPTDQKSTKKSSRLPIFEDDLFKSPLLGPEVKREINNFFYCRTEVNARFFLFGKERDRAIFAKLATLGPKGICNSCLVQFRGKILFFRVLFLWYFRSWI